jgi:hypothetical protein
MHFPPAEVEVSAEAGSTAEGDYTAVEAVTLEEAGTDEHQASDADKPTGCAACRRTGRPRGLPWTDGEQANACAEGGSNDV